MYWFCLLCKDLISKINSNRWSYQNGNLIVLYMWYVHVHLNFNPYICEIIEMLVSLHWIPELRVWLDFLCSEAPAGRDWNYTILGQKKILCLLTAIQKQPFCKQHINCKSLILQCCLFVCFCVCLKVVCCLLQNTVIFIHHMVFMDFHHKISTFFGNWEPIKKDSRSHVMY